MNTKFEIILLYEISDNYGYYSVIKISKNLRENNIGHTILKKKKIIHLYL